MRKFQKKLIFVVLFILGVQFSNAQKLTFEYLTIKDGLPQNTIQSITKDKYGFMWFGTFNGLCRYDGYKFKTYLSIPGDTTSLANSRIHYIYKDKTGVLWIATFDSYVCRYNYETDNFTRFKLSKLPQWLRDSTNRHRNLTSLQSYSSLLQQWIGNFNLSPTKEHVIFQGDSNHQTNLDDNNAYCIYRDNTGLVWIGTSTGGINKAELSAKPFHKFSITAKNNRPSTVAVRTMEADGAGGLWLGTLDTGLVYVNQAKKVEKHFSKGPSSNIVRALCKDSYGDLWIGYRTGLDRYTPATNQFYNYFNGSADPAFTENRFFSITEDPTDHSMWFGTFDHILRYDRASKKFEIQNLKSYFNRANAVSLFFDSKKNLWIGTEYSGVIELKRNAKGSQWTDTLVYNADGKAPKLPDNRVYTITEDETGNIWAGTANGLACINELAGTVKVYTKADGLADQYISKVLPDKNGSIWISHKKGLSKLVIKTGKISNYDFPESSRGYQFMDGSGCIDTTTGAINFGGTEGYISFYPNQIHDNPYLPVVVLTELQILNKTVSAGQKVNGDVVLSTPINLTKKITLTQDDRSFSIEFAALHYSNPEKNQYAYMLEGLDKDWIYTDASRRFAAYSNLHEGTYYFKVKASNGDGLWNPTPVMLEIKVLPPLWRTWWAYLCYIAGVLLGLAAFYQLILTRQRYHRDILIEKLKAEKATELDLLKSQFFTNISHEFRTPLTLIIDPLENLLSGKLPPGKLQGYYQVMDRNARRLLGLINQFLDIRKLESGSLRLHIKRQDVVSFIRNIFAAFEFQAQKRHIDFVFVTELQELNFAFDADVMDKILYNLLSNAFKFTNSRITVTLDRAGDDEITLTVTDDGPGIPTEVTEKIFEPFFQVDDDNHRVGGTGIGLSLTKELIILHKGTIMVSSEPGVRTTFTVTLPALTPIGTTQTNGRATGVSPIDGGQDIVAESDIREHPADEPVILIVEDNDDIRNYLAASLTKHYTIAEAVNGNDGFEKAIEIIPDLIVSDVMMPGMTGIDLCSKIKTDERTSHIPVVLLTARQSIESQVEGYETGADAYIIKPFSTSLLLVQIRNLIESRKKLRKLFDKSTGFNTKLITTNSADQAFMTKLTKLVETNMADEGFNVEWIAEQMFLSRTQLYRKVKSLTDLSVHDFVTTIKLNKAAEMLLDERYSVSEIAHLTGYTDPTNFTRNFQKQFGQTPKKYSQAGKAEH